MSSEKPLAWDSQWSGVWCLSPTLSLLLARWEAGSAKAHIPSAERRGPTGPCLLGG